MLASPPGVYGWPHELDSGPGGLRSDRCIVSILGSPMATGEQGFVSEGNMTWRFLAQLTGCAGMALTEAGNRRPCGFWVELKENEDHGFGSPCPESEVSGKRQKVEPGIGPKETPERTLWSVESATVGSCHC